jgi:hypothetical protein
MSTYLQLLKLTFWMLPAQRLATVLGLGVMMFLGAAVLGGTGHGYSLAAFGSLATFGMPALIGGALWRALSTPRTVQLAPAGRMRLLLAAVGIVASIALIWVAWQALFDLGLPPQWRTDLAGFRQLFVGVFAAATWWGLASFIVSRSPLAMLLVLVFTFGSAWLWDRYASTMLLLPQLWRQPWSVALPLTLWAVFGAWYLRARRIRPPGWLLPGSQSVIAAVAMAETANTGLSRRVALERLLLGGTSVLRLLTQWLLVGGLLLVILLLLARQGEQESRSVAHMAFAALILCPVIVAGLAAGVVRRARALWLPSGFSRGELFSHTEAVLLKLTITLWVLFAAFLLVLWYTQPWRPGLNLIEALLVLLLPSLLLATHALTRPHGRDFYWTWPIMLLLCVFNVWQLLITWDPAGWFNMGSPWFQLSSIVTLSDPLNGVEPRPWVWSVLAGVATIGFHLMAQRRWQVLDLPRSLTSPAS